MVVMHGWILLILYARFDLFFFLGDLFIVILIFQSLGEDERICRYPTHSNKIDLIQIEHKINGP